MTFSRTISAVAGTVFFTLSLGCATTQSIPACDLSPNINDEAELAYQLGLEYMTLGADDERYYREAESQLRRSASLGNMCAMAQLGSIYELGRGISRDPIEARKLYRLAADSGSIPAKINLAGMLGRGDGGPIDEIEARSLLEEVLEMCPSPDAQNNLGMYLGKGKGGSRDVARAFDLFVASSGQGNFSAKNNLATMFFSKPESEYYEPQIAFWLLNEAAAAGVLAAKNNLGKAYELGVIIEKDVPKAMVLYQEVIDNEIVNIADSLESGTAARINLARMHLQDKPDEAIVEEAIRLLKVAASRESTQGHSGRALYLLGTIYASRNYFHEDIMNAYRHFKNAAMQGHALANRVTGEYFENGVVVPKSYDEAERWYRRAIDLGDLYAKVKLGSLLLRRNESAESMRVAFQMFESAERDDICAARTFLGWSYRYGLGTAQDYQEAKALFLRAIEQCQDAFAYAGLGSLYEAGLGVRMDLERALENYQRSVEGGSSTGHVFLAQLYRLGRGIGKDGVEAARLVESVYRTGYVSPLPAVRRMVSEFEVEAVDRASPIETQESTNRVLLSEKLATRLADYTGIAVNESNFRVAHNASGSMLVGGGAGTLRLGLNDLVPDNLGAKLRVWWDMRTLDLFEDPYETSSALLVAIDNYPTQTGFRKLSDMVGRASELRSRLIELGFPANNIVTLFDENATSDNINRELQRFWTGGDLSETSRVFVYFGGHGSGTSGNGYLVPYDFNSNEPFASSVLMSDFNDRHFRLTNAHHYLAVIDSCSSGLAIPGMVSLGGDTDETRDWKKYVALSNLVSDTRSPARYLVVAGTGSEEALWLNGGILTRSLIEGISPPYPADLNRDGILRLTEWFLYAEDGVAAATRMSDHVQRPAIFSPTRFAGKPVFLVPRHH